MMTPATTLKQFESTVGGAVIRALTGVPDLQWSGRTLYRGVDPIPLVAPHQTDAHTTLNDQRALLDGMGLRLHHSDHRLHLRFAPQDDIERLVYELLEQCRCESLAPASMTGLRRNLRERFERWSRDFMGSGLTETSLGILLFTVAITVWTRLTGHDVDDAIADLMEATRAGIVADLGRDLAGLKQHREDQGMFIHHSLSICQWVGRAVRTATSTGTARPFKSRNGFALRLHFQADHTPPPVVAELGENKTWLATGQRYRIFTRAYDQEVDARALVRAEQLIGFRGDMDSELAALGLNVPRLARMLQRRLAIPHDPTWRFQQEEGLIDGRRLAQLISNSSQQDIFQREIEEPAVECAVTLLLDCSGSMKRHSQPMSIMADILGRALTMAGARTEVLGFSTAAWNGGRALRDWQRAGRPDMPGRLNEQLHLVFKSAATPWRNARMGLAGLRRMDLYREGMDGEAVAWACQRLLAQPAKRRLLLVVSDGCPMDSATHQHNDAYYLDQHLRQTVTHYERSANISISGVGVGLDLGCFYRRRLAVDLQDGLGEDLLLQIVDLLSKHRAPQPVGRPS